MKWNTRSHTTLKTKFYYYQWRVLFKNVARRIIREVEPQLASSLLTAPFPFGRGGEVRDLKHLRLGLRGNTLLSLRSSFLRMGSYCWNCRNTWGKELTSLSAAIVNSPCLLFLCHMFRCIMGVQWRQHGAETARAWRGASEPAGVSKHHGRQAKNSNRSTSWMLSKNSHRPPVGRKIMIILINSILTWFCIVHV